MMAKLLKSNKMQMENKLMAIKYLGGLEGKINGSGCGSRVWKGGKR